MAPQERFNAFLQEHLADKVLEHFSAGEKLQLASVCHAWRAWVARSWTTVDLDVQPCVQSQLAWLAQHVPPRFLKVTSL